uniref:DUF5405 domain-containing protein n=1 Tax=Syphacia muris TaxID=451379 RepID=A0A0N5B0S6_9BILA
MGQYKLMSYLSPANVQRFVHLISDNKEYIARVRRELFSGCRSESKIGISLLENCIRLVYVAVLAETDSSIRKVNQLTSYIIDCVCAERILFSPDRTNQP